MYRARHAVARVVGAGLVAAIAAMAVAVPTADASGSWEYFDTNGDLAYDTAAIDRTGNGNYERAYVDINGGGWDAAFYNDDDDASFEAVWIDTGGGSRVWGFDLQEDGYFEYYMVDSDRNGRYESAMYDGDGDGRFEWQAVDLRNYDGEFDTWSQTGTPQADRVINDLIVREIVTLQLIDML